MPPARSPVSRSGRRSARLRRAWGPLSYNAAPRYGYLWVALDDPLHPLPEFEEEALGFRRIDDFFEVRNCAGLRRIENSFDNAHFSFVHRASFGDQGHPEPAKLDIEGHPGGVLMITEVPLRNLEVQKKVLRMDGDETIRRMRGRWYMPFMRKLQITYPNGLVQAIITAATPIDDRISQVVQFVFRNDTEANASAENVIAFNRFVTNEERGILESADWDVPLD
ncbi:MAG: hypothetical protein ABWY34_02915 [Pseudoxanthomonas sp.]